MVMMGGHKLLAISTLRFTDTKDVLSGDLNGDHMSR